MSKKAAACLLILAAALTWAYREDPDGFAGIEWGTPLEDIQGLVFVRHDPGEDVDVYVRPADDLEFEGIELSRLEYLFWQEQFYAASLEFESYDNFLNLKAFFDERFEKGFRKGTADQVRYIALWEGEKTEVILAYHVNEEAGILWLASLKMIRKMERRTEEQSREGM